MSKKNTPTTEPTQELPEGFDAALSELRGIVDGLSQPDVSIDSLTHRIHRAHALHQHCQGKLTATRSEVQQMLAQLGLENEPGSQA
jgi:exodeoxyribonuclease VII small subunit